MGVLAELGVLEGNEESLEVEKIEESEEQVIWFEAFWRARKGWSLEGRRQGESRDEEV